MNTLAHERTSLAFDLGTFEGFNFRAQSALERTLSAQEVIDWDHDAQGEAEFWPAGDRAEVQLLFAGQPAVRASELIELDRVLSELGDDSTEHFLRIYHALHIQGRALENITATTVLDEPVDLFLGDNFWDLRRQAAYELFELYYPEEYAVWEKSHCDGLDFDTDRFLDSPSWSVVELKLGERVALIISPN